MEHHFDVEIAMEYGILEAVILNHFAFWIKTNEANQANFYEGEYWTYNSTRAFQELFPYVSQRQIQNALKRLKECGIIKTGNYNENQYDRTLWYAFTEKGKSIMQKCKMELPENVNRSCKNVKPIPDNNHIYTKYNNNIKYIVGYLNEKAGTRYKHTGQMTVRHIKARLNEGFTLEDFKTVIDKKTAEWKGTAMEKYIRPETLFGTKFESYLNSKSDAKTRDDSLDDLLP